MDSEHIEAYIAGELDEHAREQIEQVLRNDRELRESYLHQLRIHTALETMMSEGAEEKSISFEESVMARLRSEGAGNQSFAKSVLTEIVEEREGIVPLRWPDLIKAGIISAAASIALMFFLQSIMFGNAGRSGRSGSGTAAPGFVARVEMSENLKWSDTTSEKIRKDGWLTPGLIEIESGQAKIAFNSGATATIEGPVILSIESNNRLFLKEGSLSADVPKPATGFTVNTPRMNAVDIGTRFGISVAKNGDSELHVMEGEVEASRTRGNAVTTLVREGIALRADNRTRSELATIPYRGETFLLTMGETATPSPSLKYTFDDSNGGMIEDSGKDNAFDAALIATGEMGNSPRRAPGRSGSGLFFNHGDSLDVPLSREFRLEEAFTITFWVKIPPRIGPDGSEVLIQYGREELGWTFSSDRDFTSPTRGAIRVDHGGGYIVGSTDIADGNWHHIACRFIGGDNADLSSHVHLFIDGHLETISDSHKSSIESGRVGQFQLGNNASARTFEGWVDELFIFREAVPTLVIQELSK